MLKWYENPKELRRYRKELGLTQAQLASKAHVKLSLIADIESGRRRFTKKAQGPVWDALADVQSERRKIAELKSALQPLPLASLMGAAPNAFATYREACSRMEQEYGPHWREVFKALFDAPQGWRP